MEADTCKEEVGATLNAPEKIKNETNNKLSEQSLKEQATSIIAQLSEKPEVQSTDVNLTEQPKPVIGDDVSGDTEIQTTSSTQQSVDSLPTQSSHVDGNAETTENKTSVDEERPKRKKLSQSGRKRLRFLLNQGYSREEARGMAMLPMTNQPHRITGTPSTDSKRMKTSGGSDSTPSPMLQTYKLPPPLPSSLRAGEKNIKIGILSKYYPDALLTPDRLRSIQSDILDRVVRQAERDLKPRFNGIAFRDGFLEVTCADKTTAEWLKQQVPNMKPWYSATLMAVNEVDMPQPEVLIGNFPTSLGDPSDKIMGYIAAQNEGVDISNWKVLNRSIEKNMVQLTFTVDRKSFQNLKILGYKINYKFGQLQLKLKTNSGNSRR